jgi:hypothetical protein
MRSVYFNWQHFDEDDPTSHFIFPVKQGWIVFGPFNNKEDAKRNLLNFFARTRPAWMTNF